MCMSKRRDIILQFVNLQFPETYGRFCHAKFHTDRCISSSILGDKPEIWRLEFYWVPNLQRLAWLCNG